MSQDTTTQPRCFRCGRVLRSAESIRKGAGKACRKLDRQQAVVDTFPAVQVEKARELISLKAYDKQNRETFSVLSSNGEDVYTTNTEVCSCKAGQYGRVCYHRISVMLLTA